MSHCWISHEAAQIIFFYDETGKLHQKLVNLRCLIQKYKKRSITLAFLHWSSRKSGLCLIFVYLHNNACPFSYRRQYLANQVQKDFTKRSLMKLGVSCLQGWRFVIQRKHLAEQFHDKQLVRNSFNFWSTLTLRQLQQKHMEKVEYVSLTLFLLAGSFVVCWIITFASSLDPDQDRHHKICCLLLKWHCFNS